MIQVRQARSIISFDPAEHPQRQIYKLMTGIIVPRPIALVSTVDATGNANLAPFSFFAGVGSAPPTVLFCPAFDLPERKKPVSAKTRCATWKRRASS